MKFPNDYRSRFRHTWLMLFCALASSGLFAAQQSTNSPAEAGTNDLDSAKKHGERLGQFFQTNSLSARAALRGADPIMPASLPENLSDPVTQQKYLNAVQEYYAYFSAGLQHRREVFKWQLLSSKVIFVVVLILVGAGVYFAAVQFYSGLKAKRNPNTQKDENRTEIEASFQGLKVSSPVLGVIILLISLMFFYLYLVHIYPIQEIF